MRNSLLRMWRWLSKPLPSDLVERRSQQSISECQASIDQVKSESVRISAAKQAEREAGARHAARTCSAADLLNALCDPVAGRAFIANGDREAVIEKALELAEARRMGGAS